jgi:hypothetical protein
MSYTKQNIEFTGIAGADLRTHQYTFVKVDNDGEITQCDALDDAPAGVLQNAPNSGEHATVMVMGVSPLKMAGSVAGNAKVATTANGRGQAAVTGSGQNVVGIVLERVTTENAYATVALACASPAVLA